MSLIFQKKELFLKVGDQIIISGKGSYHIEKVKIIIFNGKKVRTVIRKINDNPIKINLPLHKECLSNDRIYLISKT